MSLNAKRPRSSDEEEHQGGSGLPAQSVTQPEEEAPKRPRPTTEQDCERDVLAELSFLTDVAPEALLQDLAPEALLLPPGSEISEARSSAAPLSTCSEGSTAPLTGPLASLNHLYVHNDKSEMVTIPSLFQDRRILLVFLRHFGCRFCRQQVAAIRECVQPRLRRHSVEVVLVSLGLPAHIAPFRADTGFDGEIYVDPLPSNPVAYAGFKLCGGRERLLDASGAILPHILALGEIALNEGFEEVGPPTGDVSQVGGMFVLEKDTCLFGHRSAFAGDVPEISMIVEAATGRRADGEASTAVWPGWDAECSAPPRIEAAPLAALLQSGVRHNKAPRVEQRN